MRKSLITASLALSLVVAACSSSANVTSFAPPEYLSWLDKLKLEMREKGISQNTLDTVYAQDFYHPAPEVVKIDRRQAEFVLTSTDYLNRVVNRRRVEEARRRYAELKPLLTKIENQYGVPGNYLVAFWGIETNFGSNFGGFRSEERR